MTAPARHYGHPGYEPYTADEVLGWPEDGIRHEVFDGGLHVSPHANLDHQMLLERLRTALHPALPDDWAMLGPINLRMGADTLLVPDLVVLSRVARGAVAADPADTRLVVEVVSPGSRRMDRLIKPALYAEAGITHFWLIDDLDAATGPSLRVFRLPPGATAYPFAAAQTGTVTVTEPFPVTLDLAGLLR